MSPHPTNQARAEPSPGHGLERLFTAALETAAHGVMIVDRGGLIVWTNRALTELTGYSREELIGQNPRIQKSFAHPPTFYAEMWLTITRGRIWKGEVINLHKSGRRYHEEMIITPVADPDGSITHFVALKQDITARIKTEEAARLRHAELRTLFDLVPAMIWFKDTRNCFIRVNQRVTEMTGLRPDQIEGKSARELFPQQADAHYADDLEVIRSRRPKLGVVEKLAYAGGREIWVRTDRIPVTDSTGEVSGLVALVHDITERREMEAALRKSEERFDGAFDHAPIGMALVSPEGRWLKVNHATCQILGREREELLALTFQDVTHPDDLESDLGHVRRMLAGEIETYQLEKRYLHPRGRLVHALLSVSLVRRDDGRPDYFISQIQDITERKRAEAELVAVYQQLLETSRQAGIAEAATSVLHDVGTVVNSVNVSASLVADIVARSRATRIARISTLLEDHREDLGAFLSSDPRGRLIPAYLATLGRDLAHEHAAVLTELENLRKDVGHIRDIVAAQQSHAKVSGSVETVVVADLIEDALRMNAAELAPHGIRVVRDFPRLIVAELEKNKVLQILVNLVRNAGLACAESGRIEKTITIRASARDQAVEIVVADNGVGITPENLARIFAHGFTTRPEGHGFGLHGGARVARELGGSLRCHSDGPGKGASFTLTLPRRPSPVLP